MKKFLFLLLALTVVFSHPVLASEKNYVYRETTGKTSINSEWTIKPSVEGYSVVAESVNESHRVLCNQDHSTVRWEVRNPGSGLDLAVQRDGNLLIVAGKYKGKEAKEELKIDDLPWYQFVEVSLSDFVRSARERTEFWIIQPNNLKHYKLVAIKQKTECITVHGQEVEAVQVKVTVSGVGSLFWSTQYWYRRSDGLYLRFEGVRGGPGTPKTIVELISE